MKVVGLKNQSLTLVECTAYEGINIYYHVEKAAALLFHRHHVPKMNETLLER